MPVECPLFWCCRRASQCNLWIESCEISFLLSVNHRPHKTRNLQHTQQVLHDSPSQRRRTPVHSPNLEPSDCPCWSLRICPRTILGPRGHSFGVRPGLRKPWRLVQEAGWRIALARRELACPDQRGVVPKTPMTGLITGTCCAVKATPQWICGHPQVPLSQDPRCQ